VWEELADWPWPAVAFESPRRLSATLRSLAAADPERRLAVCRELTKRHEQVVRGRAKELSEQFVEAPRGEITLVFGPGAGQQPTDATAAAQAVAELVAAGLARRQASVIVARLTGVPRKQLYDASL
jgi:16S rRNA (cytidine1402-2'-O)-methyltransferase